MQRIAYYYIFVATAKVNCEKFIIFNVLFNAYNKGYVFMKNNERLEMKHIYKRIIHRLMFFSLYLFHNVFIGFIDINISIIASVII